MKKRILQITLIVIASSLFMQCSMYKTNLISRTFHNTTSRYNAYFIAKEDLNVIEQSLLDNMENNYRKTLRIFPTIDTTSADALEDKVNNVIKKASKAIQWHINSKWVDDSYLLIGKTRYYNGEFEEAMQTFKFINIESEDNNIRHKALIQLMRAFIEIHQYRNANAVYDFLMKERELLNDENIKNLSLIRAHYYQVIGDEINMAKHINLAVPLLKTKDRKAHIHFILGQVYQSHGVDDQAYKNFKKCLKSSPDFEMDFYARLNMASVYKLYEDDDIKKARKYFDKLLKDRKNIDFRDKIYYELGKYELKQDNLDESIENFELSIENYINDNRQKAYSYLALGKIYYDITKDYEKAKTHYDSAIVAMPDDDDEYESTKKRQEILADFVEQLNTIHKQDSLLLLSEMDSSALNTLIDAVINKEKEKIKEAERKARKAAKMSAVNNQQANNGSSAFSNKSPGSVWYFYNPSLLAMGKSEFNQSWGNRALEDHWRRSDKSTLSSDSDNIENDSLSTGDSLASNSTDKKKSSKNPLLVRDTYYANIPFSEEDKATANTKIEDAYYRLGNIYKFDLEEKENAIDAFETLLDRYPITDKKAEVMYLLYLIYKDLEDEKNEQYKNKVLSDFPLSIFAKLILNPNYLEESKVAVREMKQVYNKAYKLYNANQLTAASNLIQDVQLKYPDNEFTDNVDLLRILIMGKREDINQYIVALTEFQEKYPESDMISYAQKLEKAAKEFKDNLVTGKKSPFSKNLEGAYYFVIVYPKNDTIIDDLSKTVENFGRSRFRRLHLSASNMILNDNESIIMLSEFDSKKRAFNFYSTFNKSDPIGKKYSNLKFHNFIVTKDNFHIFYRQKDKRSYLSFFKEQYLQ